MGNADSIPVVSQVRSSGQDFTGDVDRTCRPQENIGSGDQADGIPGLSQWKSSGQFTTGDTEEDQPAKENVWKGVNVSQINSGIQAMSGDVEETRQVLESFVHNTTDTQAAGNVFYGFDINRRLISAKSMSSECDQDCRRMGFISQHDLCLDLLEDWDTLPQSEQNGFLSPEISSWVRYEMPYQLADWMSGLNDITYLKYLALPGSHDAGTAQCEAVTGIFTRTQRFSIITQLLHGIRVFDIRPTRAVKSGIGSEDDDIWCHHGGYKGENVYRAVNGVKLFLTTYPRESAIAIIPHFENMSDEGVVFARIRSTMCGQAMLFGPGQRAQFESLRMRDVRGHLVVVDESLLERNLGPNGDVGTPHWGEMFDHIAIIGPKDTDRYNRYVVALTPPPGANVVETNPRELAVTGGLYGLEQWLQSPDSDKIGIVEADWFGALNDITRIISLIVQKNRNWGYYG